jgi:hypothetical protein
MAQASSRFAHCDYPCRFNVPARREFHAWNRRFWRLTSNQKVVPIHEIAGRWIGRFERHRTQALSDMKTMLEKRDE